MKHILSLLLIMTGTLVITAQNPGVQVTLSETGLNYAVNVALDQLMTAIQNERIPDQSGRESGINYSLTSMGIRSVIRPTVTISFAEAGVTGSVQNLGASVHGNWGYSKKILFATLRDSGSFDVSVRGVSATVSIALGVDASGRPTVSLTSCNANVGSVDVDFHGGWSWLYNLVTRFLERPIGNKLTSLICSTLDGAVNTQLPDQLKSLKVRIPIEDLVELDYRLVSPPVFSDNEFITSYKGEFFWAGQNTEAPFLPSVIPSVPASKMVTLVLSDYVTNTLGYVIERYGTQFTSYIMTKQDLPEDSRDFLEISGVPDVPDGSLEFHMRLTDAPRLQTTPGIASGILAGQIGLKVRQTNGSLFDVLLINMKLTVKLTVDLAGNKVVGIVSSIDFAKNVTGAASSMIPSQALDQLITMALDEFIIPKLNDIGAKGFDIPTVSGVTFSSADISIEQGYIAISTDLSYSP